MLQPWTTHFFLRKSLRHLSIQPCYWVYGTWVLSGGESSIYTHPHTCAREQRILTSSGGTSLGAQFSIRSLARNASSSEPVTNRERMQRKWSDVRLRHQLKYKKIADGARIFQSPRRIGPDEMSEKSNLYNSDIPEIVTSGFLSSYGFSSLLELLTLVDISWHDSLPSWNF